MAIVTLYKVCYRYSSGTQRNETFVDYVVAADGSSDKALEVLVKSQLPKGPANVTITEVYPLQKNIIS